MIFMVIVEGEIQFLDLRDVASRESLTPEQTTALAHMATEDRFGINMGERDNLVGVHPITEGAFN